MGTERSLGQKKIQTDANEVHYGTLRQCKDVKQSDLLEGLEESSVARVGYPCGPVAQGRREPKCTALVC